MPADISINKFSEIEIATVGEMISYVVELKNNGPDMASNFTMTDTMPGNIQNPEYSIDGGETWQPWTGSFQRASININASYYVLLRGRVSSGNIGDFIENTATVTSADDPNPANNSSTARTPISAVADLAITKTADKTTAQPGEQVTYTITLTNDGPSEARNIEITDAIPLFFQNPEYSLNGASFEPWNRTLSIPNMTNGTTNTIILRATVAPSTQGRVSNTASVRATTPDPYSGNNSASVDVTVGPPAVNSADLVISKQANRNSILPGDEIIYTVRIENRGPSDAQNVTVADEIPPQLTGAEYSADGATWQPWTGSRSLGTITTSAPVTFTIRARALSTAQGSISNTATVSSSTSDPDTGNNSATAQTPVEVPAETPADVAITKQPDRAAALGGDSLTYTLAVVNNGPGTSRNVIIIDTVADTYQNAEYSPDGGITWMAWPGSYAVGDLNSGVTASILLRGRVSAAARGSISNSASITASTPDPNPGNNSVSVQTIIDTPVELLADLSVTKQSDRASVAPNELLTYTIMTVNNGPGTAEGAELTDSVPPQLSNAEYSADNGTTWQAWSGSVRLGNISNGAAVTTLLRGLVAPSATGTVTNTASVRAVTADSDESNNSSTVSSTITSAPVPIDVARLEITKTARPLPAKPGCRVCISTTITNPGTTSVTSVQYGESLSSALCKVRYSLDNGCKWKCLTGKTALPDIPAGGTVTVLIRGKLSCCIKQPLTAVSTVSYTNSQNSTITQNAELILM